MFNVCYAYRFSLSQYLYLKLLVEYVLNVCVLLLCRSGSKRTPSQTGPVMEGVEFVKKDGVSGRFSDLLELSAFDDLTGFKNAVEEEGYDVDKSSYWYGKRIGSKKMGFEERTPLLIAARYGSKQVLSYILETFGFINY